MAEKNNDPFAGAFNGPASTPASPDREDRKSWDAPPVEPTREQPSFLGALPLEGDDAAGASSNADGPAANTTKASKKAQRKAAADKPTRRGRKASRVAPEVRAAAIDKTERIPLGQRYGGDRRLWVLMLGALALSPVVATLALAISTTKATPADVRTVVAEALKDQGAEFPSGQAVMWAGQVVRIWGTWDGSDQTGQRDVLMSQFLSTGLESTAGWNGADKQEVLYSTVNPVPTITDENHAWVDASYQIQDGTWRCVSLPVYAYQPDGFKGNDAYAFALSANPVPVACAPRTGAPALPERTDDDGATYQDATADADDLAATFMPGFFAAWAASDQATLRQYTVSDAQLVGLGGAFDSTPAPTIDSVTLPLPSNTVIESGQSYVATATVTWTVAGSAAQLTASYDVNLAREGSQWFVKSEPTPVAQDPRVSGAAAGELAQGTGGEKADLWTTPSPKAEPAAEEIAPSSSDD